MAQDDETTIIGIIGNTIITYLHIHIKNIHIVLI